MVDECGVAEHEVDCLCDVDLSKVGPVPINFTPLDVMFGPEACEITETGIPWDGSQLADLLECMGSMIEVYRGALPKWASADTIADWRSEVVLAFAEANSSDVRSDGKGGMGVSTVRKAGRSLAFLMAATGLREAPLAAFLGIPVDTLRSHIKAMLGVEPIDREWEPYKGDPANADAVRRARELRNQGIPPTAIAPILNWEGYDAKLSSVDNWVRGSKSKLTPEGKQRKLQAQREWREANRERVNATERKRYLAAKRARATEG